MHGDWRIKNKQINKKRKKTKKTMLFKCNLEYSVVVTITCKNQQQKALYQDRQRKNVSCCSYHSRIPGEQWDQNK